MKKVWWLSLLLATGCPQKTKPAPTLYRQFEEVCKSGTGVVAGLKWNRVDFDIERSRVLEEFPKSPLGAPLFTYCIAERPIRYVFGMYDGPIAWPVIRDAKCEGVFLSTGGHFCPPQSETWAVGILTNQSCDDVRKGDFWHLSWLDEGQDVPENDFIIAAKAIWRTPGARIMVPVSDACWLEAKQHNPSAESQGRP